ncbi:MAG: S8 family serine peptidase [Leptolyngbya sp. SIOISBB]|nr:S8 family serine peptidase [Leptolyngbya sp. SIOISBB]
MNLPQRSQLPPKIFAEAVVHSQSSESLLRSPTLVTSENVTRFHSNPTQLSLSAERLQAAGFEVLNVGPSSINITAAPEVYERAFGATLEIIERPVVRDRGRHEMADFINSADSAPFGEIDIAQTLWTEMLDGVAINEPAYFLQQATPSATPPQTKTRYLTVPNELAIELGAVKAHAQGITGKGVKVVIVDSGCYAEHPFFRRNNYNIDVVLGPGATNPQLDVSGHGTGVVANLLAIAPDVDLTVLKSDVALQNKSGNINSIAAFRAAVALKPDIISCSWGSDLRNPYQLSSFHKVLAAAIADAVRQGISVFFAAGNGQWGFPSQHPDVIAIGGVYKHLEGSLKGLFEASNYASSFISAIYPNRRVPDVCGLVGQLPNAAYILLPVSPGGEIDRGYAAMNDETTEKDGWAAFSGTSAAAPQLAGACALLEQFVPGLDPSKIKQILQETALDILEGSSNPASGSGLARAGPDLATGYGLLVADKAVEAANSQNLHSKNSRQTVFQGGLEESTEPMPKPKPVKQLIQLRRIKMVDCSDSPIRRELSEKLDEIVLSIKKKFREEYKDLFKKGIDLEINESNFIERDFQTDADEFLAQILIELLENGSINAEKIRKTQVLAAETLLKKRKYVSLATKTLIKASQLKKDTRYFIGSDEIPRSEVVSLRFKLVGNNSLISGIDNNEPNKTRDGEPYINTKSENRDLIVREIKGKPLEIVDGEEISILAVKILKEIDISPKKAPTSIILDTFPGIEPDSLLGDTVEIDGRIVSNATRIDFITEPESGDVIGRRYNITRRDNEGNPVRDSEGNILSEVIKCYGNPVSEFWYEDANGNPVFRQVYKNCFR